ncbi:(2Fe-2S)-binding protein [Glycomyces xiaoerkulensis]|uniref:(2Fe-2S)-binding protein n=1 Tax=Glycomyces xiaoerkulensis TaxID=2038139 RepID=UPI000C25A534|nr:(2Fe-2S)-binding protein [Glycomyces xiaoerkulensis]
MRVSVDGIETEAMPGQTVAGLLLAMGRDSWRTTRVRGRPRGLFCGIGVCHDCLVRVNGVRDVRACVRVLTKGDRVQSQDDEGTRP